MARRDDDDIEALLAEVDRTLSGRSGRPSASRPSREPARDVERREPGGWRDEVARRTRTAAVSAVLAAAVIFALFAVTPFLGSVSGAAGAAIATFVVVLLLPRRH